MKLVLLLCLVGYVLADTNMINPRGSNNRFMRNRANDPNNRQTSNANRLFDSQTNNNAGYDWGEGKMEFYEGSELSIEFNLQHGCGNDLAKTKCDVILQYTCGKDVRDGATTNTIPATDTQSLDPSYGMHESYQFYEKCDMRLRNTGLFTADQELNGVRATYTRQEPNGNDRYGFECPEERDYYPYWQWSPWVDIAVLTTDPARCQYYQTESQNVKARGYCIDRLNTQNPDPWMHIDEASCKAVGFAWAVNNTIDGVASTMNLPDSRSWSIDPPHCVEAPWTRDNNLGNARMRGAICCLNGNCQDWPGTKETCEAQVNGNYYGALSGIDLPAFNWTIPTVDRIAAIFSETPFGGALAAENCVIRLRYNVSSTDYDGWTTDSSANGPTYSPVVNDPWADYGWNFLLRLAIDTTQFARGFEDRSHVFSILRRPTTITSWTRSDAVPTPASGSPYLWTSSVVTPDWTANKIYNLNVIGRRGTHVQAYPSENYAFHPRILHLKVGDFIHPQWTGTHAAPVDSVGEGATSTDAHGLVQIEDLLHNWPIDPQRQSLFEPNTAWNLQFSGIFNSAGGENSAALVPPEAGASQVCLTQRELELKYRDQVGSMQQLYERIRHDQYNCAKLSGRLVPHFDGGLIQMNNPGCYYFMDPRNNKPGLQTVKGTICVEP
jgi:hypothetical protein